MNMIKVVQAGMGIYSVMMPTAATRKAIKWLTTPKQTDFTSLENMTLASTRVEMIGHNTTVYSWDGGAKVALILHGWSGHYAQFYRYINTLIQAGYSVYALAPQGHGRTLGMRSHAGMFINSLKAFHEWFGQDIDLAIGHSMGAASLLYAASELNLYRQVLLFSAPSAIKDVLNDFAKGVNLSSRSTAIFLQSMEVVSGYPLSELDMYRRAEKVHAPVLLVHDERDRQIAYENALKLKQGLSHGQLLSTTGLGHSRLLTDEHVHAKIAAALKLSSK